MLSDGMIQILLCLLVFWIDCVIDVIVIMRLHENEGNLMPSAGSYVCAYIDRETGGVSTVPKSPYLVTIRMSRWIMVVMKSYRSWPFWLILSRLTGQICWSLLRYSGVLAYMVLTSIMRLHFYFGFVWMNIKSSSSSNHIKTWQLDCEMRTIDHELSNIYLAYTD